MTTKIEPELHSVDEVTISRESYQRLIKQSHFLMLLKSYGVDNWEGYSEAMSVFEEVVYKDDVLEILTW